MVPPRGFEPLTLAGQRSERCAYANSATGAQFYFPLPSYFSKIAQKFRVFSP